MDSPESNARTVGAHPQCRDLIALWQDAVAILEDEVGRLQDGICVETDRLLARVDKEARKIVQSAYDLPGHLLVENPTDKKIVYVGHLLGHLPIKLVTKIQDGPADPTKDRLLSGIYSHKRWVEECEALEMIPVPETSPG
jgi:hypothetical protein